ncbi:hypothetical protein [Salinispora vitiensis]|nr:hypothetical protein [Salinispora vitiensis]
MADKKNPVQFSEPSAAEREFAQQLVERAKTDGVSKGRAQEEGSPDVMA